MCSKHRRLARGCKLCFPSWSAGRIGSVCRWHWTGGGSQMKSLDRGTWRNTNMELCSKRGLNEAVLPPHPHLHATFISQIGPPPPVSPNRQNRQRPQKNAKTKTLHQNCTDHKKSSNKDPISHATHSSHPPMSHNTTTTHDTATIHIYLQNRIASCRLNSVRIQNKKYHPCQQQKKHRRS